MFESMKMYLKGKIEESTEVTRIRDKLYKFLTYNPDVDHYLCEMRRKDKDKSNALGLLFGFIFGLLLGLIMLFLVMLKYYITYGSPKIW